MLRAYTDRLLRGRRQTQHTHQQSAPRRSATLPAKPSLPENAFVRDGDSTSPSCPSTPLPALPKVPRGTTYSPVQVRRAVGEAQLQRARLAAANGESPACALITLAPEGLVASGVARDAASAGKVIAALREHRVLDDQTRVSRPIDCLALDQALAGLNFDANQCRRAHDAIKVARFLFEFGVREVAFSFDSELSCGDAFLAKKGTAGNYESFLKALFDPTHSAIRNAQLQRALIDLTR